MMEHMDLETANRQFLLESHGYLSAGAGSCTSSSSNHSDLLFYDDSSNSGVSSYSYETDDENSPDSVGKKNLNIKKAPNNLFSISGWRETLAA